MQAMNDIISVETVKTESKLLPWVVCLAAALFFFYEFIQAHMFNSIALDVMQAFAIKAERYSWLTGIYYAANVIFLFPAGIMLDRYSTKKIIITALVLCILGTALFAVTSSFALALTCRFLTGIGSAFCFLSSIRLATRWFSPNKLAFVTGVLVTFAMTGGMMAQTPMTLLVEAVGWREAILIDAALGVLILSLIITFVQDFPANYKAPVAKTNAEHPSFWKSCYEAYFKLHNILCALYTSLMNMPVVVLGAMAGDMYLVQAGHLSRTQASLVNSMIFVGTIIGGPLIGKISDNLKMRRIPMIIGTLLSLGIIAIIIGVSSLSFVSLLVLFLLLGLCTSSQVLSYPLVAETNSPLITAMAVSVVMILTQGGSMLYQTIFGYLLQLGWDGTLADNLAIYSSSDYNHALWMIPIGFILALIAVLSLKKES